MRSTSDRGASVREFVGWLLFTCSLSSMVTIGLGTGINTLVVLLLCSLAYGLIVLVYGRPLVLVGFLAATALLMCLLLLFVPSVLHGASAAIQNFIVDIQDLVLVRAPLELLSLRIIWYLATAIICLGLFACVRSRLHMILYLLAGGIFFSAYWYGGYRSALVLAALYLIGCLYQLGYSRARGHLAANTLKPSCVRGWFRTISLSSLLIVLAAALLPRHPERDTLVRAFNELGRSGTIQTNLPRSIVDVDEDSESFSLAEQGFQPSPKQLGGPASLSDAVVMHVESPVPLYLRGSVKTLYENNNWLNSALPRAPFDFRRALPAFRSVSVADTDITRVSISLREETGYNIFTPSEPYRIDSKRHGYFTHDGDDNFFFPVPTKARELYHVDVLLSLYDTYSSEKPQPLHSIPELDDAELRRTLTVPASFTQRSAELTAKICAPWPSDWEKALALRDYLQTKYTYRLDAPYTPEGKDFVDNFLFELRAGYCTYFASALVLMLRSSGIPARYVEGYLVIEPAAGSGFTVRSNTAHAWAEAYIDQLGWVTLDATPEYQENSASIPKLQALHRQELKQSKDNPKQSLASQVFSFAGRIVLLLMLTGIFAGLALLSVRFLALRRLERKLGRSTNLEAFQFHYRQILRLYSLLGLPDRPGETLTEFSQRVNSLYVFTNIHFSQLTVWYQDGFYGQSPLMAQQVDTVASFRANLRTSAKVQKGRLRFWWHTLITDYQNTGTGRNQP